MLCMQCQREIVDESVYCTFCGARQQGNQPQDKRRLRRSISERRIAGICGGLAEYFDVDVSLVRLAWVVLSIVPGAILFGVLAYLAAWVLMPESAEVPVARPAAATRLTRSATDRKIGGVCGGLAEYFSVDPTAVRLLWVVLSIIPGAIICGVLAYVVAWLIMPMVPLPETTASPATGSAT